MDNARSPLWQKAKHGALNPVMRMAHRVNPISEEDLRYTLAGGFHPSDLDGRVAAVGCRGWYRPTGLLHYLATRAAQIFSGTSSRFDLGRRAWRSTADGGPTSSYGRTGASSRRFCEPTAGSSASPGRGKPDAPGVGLQQARRDGNGQPVDKR